MGIFEKAKNNKLKGYGYEIDDPIMVKTVQEEYAYLKYMTLEDHSENELYSAKRVGSRSCEKFAGPVDLFEIGLYNKKLGESVVFKLYICAYPLSGQQYDAKECLLSYVMTSDGDGDIPYPDGFVNIKEYTLRVRENELKATYPNWEGHKDSKNQFKEIEEFNKSCNGYAYEWTNPKLHCHYKFELPNIDKVIINPTENELSMFDKKTKTKIFGHCFIYQDQELKKLCYFQFRHDSILDFESYIIINKNAVYIKAWFTDIIVVFNNEENAGTFYEDVVAIQKKEEPREEKLQELTKQLVINQRIENKSLDTEIEHHLRKFKLTNCKVYYTQLKDTLPAGTVQTNEGCLVFGIMKKHFRKKLEKSIIKDFHISGMTKQDIIDNAYYMRYEIENYSSDLPQEFINDARIFTTDLKHLPSSVKINGINPINPSEQDIPIEDVKMPNIEIQKYIFCENEQILNKLTTDIDKFVWIRKTSQC